MKITDTALEGVYLIEQEVHNDERGSFSRIFCQKSFESHGLLHSIIQTSESINKNKATIRGMHFQNEPYQETKLIRCIKGQLFDVLIDLRADSASFNKVLTLELSEDDNLLLYVPKGIAHGFQTLKNNTAISYYMLEGEYNAESAKGVAWNDPFFNIAWPLTENLIISARDRSFAFIDDRQ